jgi:hypothetical protein
MGIIRMDFLLIHARPIEAPHSFQKSDLKTDDADDKSGKICLQPDEILDESS